MAPPTVIKVEMIVLGETQVNRRIMRWSARAGDARPVWGVISEYLMRVEARMFDTEGASSGHPWAPLKESTIKYKERYGLRPEILRATDALRNALTIPGDSNQKIVPTKSTLVFGAKGEPSHYGPILMKVQPGGISRPRKPIDLTELNRRACVKMIQLWIARGVTRMVGV